MTPWPCKEGHWRYSGRDEAEENGIPDMVRTVDGNVTAGELKLRESVPREHSNEECINRHSNKGFS